jgi:hypothetical protein
MPSVAYERRARSMFSYMVHGAGCMDKALVIEVVHYILPRLLLEDGRLQAVVITLHCVRYTTYYYIEQFGYYHYSNHSSDVKTYR